MSGHPELNFPAFHAKAAELRAKGVDVVNPAEIEQPDPTSWKSCMKVDIAHMKTCSVILMLPGWEKSRGARIEHWLAKRWGLRVEVVANKNQFENILDMVIATITIKADIASHEIYHRCEFIRRSLGQKTRGAIARASK